MGKETKELYYYTKADTMRYILTGGNIFATHINYLNDYEEYLNGLRELKEIMQSDFFSNEDAKRMFGTQGSNNLMDEMPELYSISFSEEKDLLSQWYMYAQESGVRIKFYFKNAQCEFQLENLDKKQELVNKNIKSVYYCTRRSMNKEDYDTEAQRIASYLKEELGRIASEQQITDQEALLASLWMEVAPYIKNYEFRQEKEHRIVFGNEIQEQKLVVNYRSDQELLKPYIDVKNPDGWPIREIMVGPGRKQEKVFGGICHLLEHQQLKLAAKDEEEEQAVVEDYFYGMREYQIEEAVLTECIELFQEDKVVIKKNTNFKKTIEGICKRKIPNGIEDYNKNNYISLQGIIVRKSKIPYQF